MCKSWCELIIGLVVIVFALWDTMMYSKLILIIAGVILLIHSFMCKKCFGEMKAIEKPTPVKKKR